MICGTVKWMQPIGQHSSKQCMQIVQIIPDADFFIKSFKMFCVSLIFNRYPLDTRKISTFFMHYMVDFASVFIHVSIYAASSTYHMATCVYVSAMILDTTSILQQCDISAKLLSARDAVVNNALNKAIALHANVLE